MADEVGKSEERAGKGLVAGERPLLGFVSSVMRPELEWAREATVNALADNPATIPWAFEFTPASSELSDEAYLSKVRDADVVIWLVGSETTPAVNNEIAQALAAKVRIWAIRLPADTRDARTVDLLSRLQPVAKWADANDADDLREVLALTFTDEVIRAIRGVPALSRLAALEQLARASRERMVVRWQATGLSRAEAIRVADDQAIGRPLPTALPNASSLP